MFLGLSVYLCGSSNKPGFLVNQCLVQADLVLDCLQYAQARSLYSVGPDGSRVGHRSGVQYHLLQADLVSRRETLQERAELSLGAGQSSLDTLAVSFDPVETPDQVFCRLGPRNRGVVN